MSSLNRFTRKAQSALEISLEYAKRLGHTYIGSEHLLLGLTGEGDSVSAKLLLSHGVSFEEIKKAVLEVTGLGIQGNVNASDLTPSARRIIEHSAHIAKKYEQKSIGTEHILLALSEQSECVGVRILESLNVSVYELKSELANFIESTSPKGKNDENVDGKREKLKIAGCPSLSEFGRDLTALAREGRIDPIIARERETDRVVQILSRRTKNNPCIIGEPGVGKTAVVEGLAIKIASDEVPEMLRGKMVITLDVPAMIAGAKYRGEFEDRMKKVMRECSQNPDVILFIDELHTIIGAGGAEGAVDAANIIKPALARGEMQIIGATTVAEYRKHVEKDSALERRFQSVLVEEPSAEDAEKILFGLRDKYERHHGLKISDDAIHSAVKLSARYIPERFLPDKAIDLVDEAASAVRISAFTPPMSLKRIEARLRELSRDKEKAIVGQDFEGAVRLRDEEKDLLIKLGKERTIWEESVAERKREVGEEDVAEVVTRWTSIPIQKLVESENEKLLHLADRLRERVIGQDKAVDAISSAIRRGRLGLSDPERPIGSFIFSGPTGVGKTELAKALSELMFGSRDAMIRFDMSEYMEKHSVSKLIGSPPGYVGYDEGGLLTESVRRRPYSVVLFDEIEKADPDIFNIMLQILDDGTLTDSQGRRVSFRNTIIIMTSNVGSPKPTESQRIGFSEFSDSDDEKKRSVERIKKALFETFRPEFLNRIDEIITFSPLSRDSVRQIAEIMLEGFKKRVFDMGMEVSFDDAVINKIVSEGYDNFFGARPLRRAITRLVEDSFSRELLKGRFSAGDKIQVSLSDSGEVAFSDKSVAVGI